MKTLDEMYNEIIRNDELKKEFLEVLKNNGDPKDFLKQHDCPVSAEELEEYMKDKQKANRELSEDEMAAVAGGTKSPGLVSACNLGLDCEWDKIL